LLIYLESLVLEDSLDRRVLTTGGHFGLEDHAERAIAYNLALRVGNFLGLAGQAIVDLFVDNLYRGEGQLRGSIYQPLTDLPPMRPDGSNPGRLCDMMGEVI